MLTSQREYAEKRDYIRMRVDCRVVCQPTDGGRSFEAVGINLSAGGIMFETDRALQEDTEYAISVLSDTPSVSPLQASVQVVRVARIDGRYHVGARFLGAPH
jgi:hypothetical protein